MFCALPFVVAADTADDRGAAREFLTRENSELTSVYDDWSCSSSSEKGLKLVRLVTSSTRRVELLLDFSALPLATFGEVGCCGESMLHYTAVSAYQCFLGFCDRGVIIAGSA